MIVKLFFFVLYFGLTKSICPEGSIEWQNLCYSFQSNLTSFPNAELACTKMNGNLVSIHDGFTNALLAGLGQASNLFHESTVVDFWIGLNTLILPGNWSWMDKTDFDYNNWAPSDTQNLSCSAVTIQNGYWKSDDCFKTKPFICDVPHMPTTPRPAYVNCSHGWIYFEPTNSCYGKDYIGALVTNWTNAEQYCENQNAHLVSLHSFEETKFLSLLYDATSYSIWTGLYSNDNEATWKWSDETPVDYLPWLSGYPKRNVSSCVWLADERIYDYDCSVTAAILCKKAGPSFM